MELLLFRLRNFEVLLPLLDYSLTLSNQSITKHILLIQFFIAFTCQVKIQITKVMSNRSKSLLRNPTIHQNNPVHPVRYHGWDLSLGVGEFGEGVVEHLRIQATHLTQDIILTPTLLIIQICQDSFHFLLQFLFQHPLHLLKILNHLVAVVE